jgi:cellulose synthase (UDP-forming)
VERVFIAAWLALSLAFLAICAVPMHLGAQAAVNTTLVVLLLVMRRRRLSYTVRLGFLLVASYVSLRYFFWRLFETIGFHDPLSFVAAVALFGAEVYGIAVYGLGIFVNVSPLERKPVPLPEDESEWPSVDVMIPSYNEEPELLEVTLRAALQIDYPQDKLRVHLLDDGGTLQKRRDTNPDKALEAQKRHLELRELCETLGAVYHTREKNEHAKAGNVNAALPNTDGDLVLILDADHVPTRDILRNTTGLFVDDDKLFLVQTPHFFINPDPLERNLGTFGEMPSENQMFYGVIQKGLDFWGASFFCGSAAILRKSCLMEIGGISGITITEDAETALDLHARGYRSAYIDRPMIAGLQPETFTGFVTQRVRWAQGMVQIFLLKNPLLLKGLKLRQRLCYLNSSFFWFFCYARVMFVLAPVAHLVFGLRVYDANLAEFAAFALPHVVAAVIVSHKIFGSVRWTLVSELYELMQSFFSLKGIVKVLRNPRAPTFLVTPKGERLDRDFISPLARPFYVLLALSLLAMVAGGLRLALQPLERDAVYITMAWNTLNLVLLAGGLGALLERKQMRRAPRVPCSLPGTLLAGTHEVPCRIIDLSVGGAGIRVAASELEKVRGRMKGFLRVALRGAGRDATIPVHMRHMTAPQDGHFRFGLEFDAGSSHDKSEIVALVHGDSEAWAELQQKRARNIGLGPGARYLVERGLHHASAHFAHAAQNALIDAAGRSLAAFRRARAALVRRGRTLRRPPMGEMR